ncbi:MAG: arsenate reductase ArsC [Phycisphaerales bacterium]|nr:arsenate reductase ArsC [Phycisphaerales bacterium]
MTEGHRRPRVLFLCTGNACRSQMAEGWATHLHADVIEASSAGTEPHGVHPLAIRVMWEADVDISTHESTSLDEIDVTSLDVVITVCAHAHESCPVLPSGVTVVHHGFDDPPRLAIDARTDEEAMVHFRRVRDDIRAFVETLPEVVAGAMRSKGGAQ